MSTDCGQAAVQGYLTCQSHIDPKYSTEKYKGTYKYISFAVYQEALYSVMISCPGSSS